MFPRPIACVAIALLTCLAGCSTSQPRHIANNPPVIQGALKHTGRLLDVGIEGEGFFVVRLLNGQIAYTRCGSLFVDDLGQVFVGAGKAKYPYRLAMPREIPAGATNIRISTDGFVDCIIPGKPTRQTLGQFQIALFPNPAELKALNNDDPVYLETKSSGKPVITYPGEQGAGQVVQTFLEVASND